VPPVNRQRGPRRVELLREQQFQPLRRGDRDVVPQGAGHGQHAHPGRRAMRAGRRAPAVSGPGLLLLTANLFVFASQRHLRLPSFNREENVALRLLPTPVRIAALADP
jgi:hypothetical protein